MGSFVSRSCGACCCGFCLYACMVGGVSLGSAWRSSPAAPPASSSTGSCGARELARLELLVGLLRCQLCADVFGCVRWRVHFDLASSTSARQQQFVSRAHWGKLNTHRRRSDRLVELEPQLRRRRQHGRLTRRVDHLQTHRRLLRAHVQEDCAGSDQRRQYRDGRQCSTANTTSTQTTTHSAQPWTPRARRGSGTRRSSVPYGPRRPARPPGRRSRGS